MFLNAKPFSRFSLLVMVLAASRAQALSAQALSAQGGRPKAWTATVALTGLRVGKSDSWAYGPELGLRRDFGPRWGVVLRASLPIFDTQPFSDDGAVALDLGPTLSFRTDRTELGLSAGATGFLVGDRGELIDGGVGAFADGHATAWLTPGVGLVAGATVRLAGDGAAYPSISAGLSAKF